MPPEPMARSEPTSLATGIIVQIWTTRIFSRSISLLIAALQRVLQPQIEVRMTPLTPADFKRSAILWPMRVAFSTAARRGGVDRFVEFADNSLLLQFTHHVQRHQATAS